MSLNTSGTEDVNGIHIDDDGSVNLTTLGNYDVDVLAGVPADAFHCDLSNSGNNTACAGITKRFDGAASDFAGEVMDGLYIESGSLAADRHFNLNRQFNEAHREQVDASELEDMIDDIDDNLETFPEENNSGSSFL